MIKMGGPKIRVELKLKGDQADACVPTFSSRDEIRGDAIVTSQEDLTFNDVYITFEGCVRTYVEKVATASPTSNKTDAFHYFLRLIQPPDISSFADPPVLEAHKTYIFPFNFVMPDQLLPQSCDHEKAADLPEDAHLAPPPSLGDPAMALFGKGVNDDMCPDMARIIYTLRCRISSGRSSGGKLVALADANKKIRILPVVDEAPPLRIEGGSNDYCLRKEKTIQKGSFRKKLGRVCVESAQPKSLRLPSPHCQEKSPVTTMATLNIRFDPNDEKCEPPKLVGIGTKLKVATFYASRPIKNQIYKSVEFAYDNHRGLFVDACPLSERNLTNVEWERQTPDENPGPSSADPVDSHSRIPAPSRDYQGHDFFTARIKVPINLPKGNKVFVPTFHNCLVSRIYAIDMCLKLEQAKATILNPVVSLKLPIQISCAPDSSVSRTPSAPETNGSTGESPDNYIRPRNTTAPNSNNDRRPSQILGLAGTNTASSPQSPAHDPNEASTSSTDQKDSANHVAFAEGVSTGPGEGLCHRSSWTIGMTPDRAPQNVRMLEQEHRLQSLSFEGDEAAQIANMASGRDELPPDYAAVGGRWRGRIMGSGPRRMSGT